MASKTIMEQIRGRLNSFLPGQVFALSDFFDIAKPKTISKFMERICSNESFEKLYRGIFWKKDADCSQPTPKELSKAIARSNGWRIAPCGETALYLIGFQEKKPSSWTFISNGGNCTYEIKGMHLDFKHAAPRYTSGYSEQTATVVQALKSIGEHALTPDIIFKILSFLKKAGVGVSTFITEIQKAPSWISRFVCCSIRNHPGKNEVHE